MRKESIQTLVGLAAVGAFGSAHAEERVRITVLAEARSAQTNPADNSIVDARPASVLGLDLQDRKEKWSANVRIGTPFGQKPERVYGTFCTNNVLGIDALCTDIAHQFDERVTYLSGYGMRTFKKAPFSPTVAAGYDSDRIPFVDITAALLSEARTPLGTASLSAGGGYYREGYFRAVGSLSQTLASEMTVSEGVEISKFRSTKKADVTVHVQFSKKFK